MTKMKIRTLDLVYILSFLTISPLMAMQDFEPGGNVQKDQAGMDDYNRGEAFNNPDDQRTYNPHEAVRYFKMAVDKGNVDALYELGKIHLDAEPGSDLKDPREAERYFVMAAKEGHADASFMLGEIYRKRGQIKSARLFYSDGAKLGSEAAKNALELLKREDQGAAQDKDTFYNVGMAYQGKGDRVKAIASLQKAAEMGHVAAMVELGDIYQETKEFDSAIQWYNAASRYGDSRAGLKAASLNKYIAELNAYHRQIKNLEDAIISPTTDQLTKYRSMVTLGRSYRLDPLLGGVDKAFGYFKEAISENNPDKGSKSEAYYQLSLLLKDKGESENVVINYLWDAAELGNLQAIQDIGRIEPSALKTKIIDLYRTQLKDSYKLIFADLDEEVDNEKINENKYIKSSHCQNATVIYNQPEKYIQGINSAYFPNESEKYKIGKEIILKEEIKGNIQETPVGYNIYLPKTDIKGVFVDVYGGWQTKDRLDRLSKPTSMLQDYECYLLDQGIAIIKLNLIDFLESNDFQMQMQEDIHNRIHKSINYFYGIIRNNPKAIHEKLDIPKEVKIYLYGASFGGRTAVRQAEMYPDTFDGYISHDGALSKKRYIENRTKEILYNEFIIENAVNVFNYREYFSQASFLNKLLGKETLSESEYLENVKTGASPKGKMTKYNIKKDQILEYLIKTQNRTDLDPKAYPWIFPMDYDAQEAKIRKISKPIMLLHNSDDSNVDVKGSIDFYKKAKEILKDERVQLHITKKGNPLPSVEKAINRGHFPSEFKSYGETIAEFIKNGNFDNKKVDQWLMDYYDTIDNSNDFYNLDDKFVSEAFRLYRSSDKTMGFENIWSNTLRHIFDLLAYIESFHRIENIGILQNEIGNILSMNDAGLYENALKGQLPEFFQYLKERYVGRFKTLVPNDKSQIEEFSKDKRLQESFKYLLKNPSNDLKFKPYMVYSFYSKNINIIKNRLMEMALRGVLTKYYFSVDERKNKCKDIIFSVLSNIKNVESIKNTELKLLENLKIEDVINSETKHKDDYFKNLIQNLDQSLSSLMKPGELDKNIKDYMEKEVKEGNISNAEFVEVKGQRNLSLMDIYATYAAEKRRKKMEDLKKKLKEKINNYETSTLKLIQKLWDQNKEELLKLGVGESNIKIRELAKKSNIELTPDEVKYALQDIQEGKKTSVRKVLNFIDLKNKNKIICPPKLEPLQMESIIKNSTFVEDKDKLKTIYDIDEVNRNKLSEIYAQSKGWVYNYKFFNLNPSGTPKVGSTVNPISDVPISNAIICDYYMASEISRAESKKVDFQLYYDIFESPKEKLLSLGINEIKDINKESTLKDFQIVFNKIMEDEKIKGYPQEDYKLIKLNLEAMGYYLSHKVNNETILVPSSSGDRSQSEEEFPGGPALKSIRLPEKSEDIPPQRQTSAIPEESNPEKPQQSPQTNEGDKAPPQPRSRWFW